MCFNSTQRLWLAIAHGSDKQHHIPNYVPFSLLSLTFSFLPNIVAYFSNVIHCLQEKYTPLKFFKYPSHLKWYKQAPGSHTYPSRAQVTFVYTGPPSFHLSPRCWCCLISSQWHFLSAAQVGNPVWFYENVPAVFHQSWILCTHVRPELAELFILLFPSISLLPLPLNVIVKKQSNHLPFYLDVKKSYHIWKKGCFDLNLVMSSSNWYLAVSSLFQVH